MKSATTRFNKGESMEIEIDIEKNKKEAERAWYESGEAQRNAELLIANTMTAQLAIHNLTVQVKRIADILEPTPQDKE
jgi:hypothetical protein